MVRNDTKVYVGNLPSDIKEREVEDIFAKFGRIRNVEIKGSASRGPLFAFVEFDDPRDADDAIRGRDGYDFDGHRIRVEMTRGSGPRGPGGRPLYGGRDDRGDRGGFRSDSFRRSSQPKRSENRVIIEGLPSTGSWQDLKDHMREAGEVCYADVARDGTGVVEFTRREDMEYALKNLDDTKFKSHKGDTSYIHIREDGKGSGNRRSRSPRRSPQYKEGSRSPNSPRRSPMRSRSRSRS